MFTRDEFFRALDPAHARSPRTLETLLSYHTRQGHLIEPTLLTGDRDMAERIATHPGLAWKVLNVKKHKTTR